MNMKNQRLLSLDALRGFDMFFIMGLSALVVSVCNLFPGGVSETIAEQMKHVSWDGLAHHDTIFPLFLFLAGVSFPFSYANQLSKGASRGKIYAKIFKRALVLVFLGLIYNGLLKFDFEELRCASVLARIGLAWMGAALLFINFGVRTRAIICAVILVGYGLFMALVGAPDVQDALPLSLEGNLVGYVDRLFLPGRLLYSKYGFDPEGLLSTVPAVVTAMLGMFTGELIRLPKERMSGEKKTLWMVAGAVVLLVITLLADGFLPINKKLWSSTFVCAVGSYSLFMMAIFYYIIDVRGWRKWTFVFRVVGMNSITIYLAQRMINFSSTNKFLFSGFAGLFSENVGAVIANLGYIVVCWLFLYFLYRKNVFLKV
ncbi:MAG: DUF5009 domain-containing protein [Bacteroidaceae bacterium]|nr:DUF5009 domain-containing protein [Bacteroidaceae bacterium]